MSLDFLSRMVGMVVFAILGARLGADTGPSLGIPQQAGGILFGLVGALIGLILTPWITLRPVRALRRMVNELSIDVLAMTLLGAAVGLVLTLLLAYPLSLLGGVFGSLLPAIVSVTGTYLLATTFALRSREIWETVFSSSSRKSMLGAPSRQVIIDTSALIDGRIVDIIRTGFLAGTIIVPRFILSELHHVADSSDTLRRNRGRRGLVKLNELQRSDFIVVKIVEDDFEDIAEVDDKLIALAGRYEAAIITNDFNLNKVADAQGVLVLNINLLANAVRSIYIPGEAFHIHVFQEGREPNQGVGYLEDGTMVIVEQGRQFMDRTIKVIVTRLINRETGRIIFAVPEGVERKGNFTAETE
jgi:uncharacterized protein YacL